MVASETPQIEYSTAPRSARKTRSRRCIRWITRVSGASSSEGEDAIGCGHRSFEVMEADGNSEMRCSDRRTERVL